MRESLLCFAATISPFLSSSHLITTVLIPSCVTWAFLTSSEFIWTLLFSALLSFSILRSSSQLISSQLFTALLSLASAPFISPHFSTSFLEHSCEIFWLKVFEPFLNFLVTVHLIFRHFSFLTCLTTCFCRPSSLPISSHLMPRKNKKRLHWPNSQDSANERDVTWHCRQFATTYLRRENEAFGQDFPQKVKVEDLKTKL